MFRARDRRRLLAGDNWYLRHSPTPSSFTSASHLHPAPVSSKLHPAPVSKLHPAPVSLVSDLVKPAAMQPVTVTVPSSRRRAQETPGGPRRSSQETSREPRRGSVPAGGQVAAGGGAGGYDRQISRVRSLSVFSSESHCIQQEQDLHSDTDTPDSLSLDFNILDHNNQDSDEVL